MRRFKARAPLALIAALAVAAACGKSYTTATTYNPPNTPNPPPSGAKSVTISDFAFTPASITIAKGSSVTWTNNGPSTHTVTAGDGSFNSGNLPSGGKFSHTFSTTGTFAYHCAIHPQMTGSVVVQ